MAATLRRVTALRLRPGAQLDIVDLRRAYLESNTAPLDGMWLSFALAAEVTLIEAGNVVVGFASVDAERRVLEFFVRRPELAREAFGLVAAEADGAMAPTTSPSFLSLAMDRQQRVAVNALLYQARDEAYRRERSPPEGTALRELGSGELELALDFGELAIPAPRDWLTGYYRERIAKGELFGLWSGAELIAAGELRPSPLQPGVADLGMVVAERHRRRGLATRILELLIVRAGERGLRAICSTEASNPGAQKAIERAGFIAQHRLLEITFDRG